MLALYGFSQGLYPQPEDGYEIICLREEHKWRL